MKTNKLAQEDIQQEYASDERKEYATKIWNVSTDILKGKKDQKEEKECYQESSHQKQTKVRR